MKEEPLSRQVSFNSLGLVLSYVHPIDPNWVKFIAGQMDRRRTLADVGGGPGRYALALGKSGFVVRVYDTSAAAVSVANSLGVQAEVAEATNLPIRESGVDAVLMRTVVHHLRSIKDAFAESYRVLCRGGLLIVQTRSYDNLERSPLHTLMKNRGVLERDWERWPDPKNLVRLMAVSGFAEVKTHQIREREGLESRRDFIRRIRNRGGDSLLQLLTDGEIDELIKKICADRRTSFDRSSGWTAIVGKIS